MRIWGKSMGKRILIGSLLVLTLLLLMPSIPAVQQRSIEDSIETRENILLERLKDINVEKVNNLLNKGLPEPKLLTLLIIIIGDFRWFRGEASRRVRSPG